MVDKTDLVVHRGALAGSGRGHNPGLLVGHLDAAMVAQQSQGSPEDDGRLAVVRANTLASI